MKKISHPFNDCEKLPPQTSLLIVGTAPPPRFSSQATPKALRGLDFEFYYGSEDNDMWIILEEIAGRREGIKLFQDDYSSKECIDAARYFLKRHNISMKDVLNTYQRKSGRDESASDSDIVPPEPEDFLRFKPIFERCSLLRAIAFTSQQAAHWTFAAMRQQGLIQVIGLSNILAEWRARGEGIARYSAPLLELSVSSRIVRFFVLPSPSLRSPLSYEAKRAVYENILFDTSRS